MKYLLAICLLLPVLAAAQHNPYEDVRTRWFKDSTGQPVRLPIKRDIDLHLQRHLFTSTNRGLVVSSDTAYKTLFKTIPPDSLPAINFTTHYLLGRRACVYCGASCTHRACHRQACSYFIHWVVMPKENLQSTNLQSGLVGHQPRNFEF